jgi:uncharacterized protein YfaT (DUF1175 family)
MPLAMTKPKAKKAEAHPEPEETTEMVNTLQFKSSAAYRDWFVRLVKHARKNRHTWNATDLADRAFVAYAKSIGFEEEAPPR